jgi:hypothetical protein
VCPMRKRLQFTDFRPAALSICAASALMAGCGGGSQLPAAGQATTVDPSVKKSAEFRYTGKRQRFKVPKGVTNVTILARGGGTPTAQYTTGAFGGLVKATIAVTPGETLYVFVGGAGKTGAGYAGGAGGFNGGAAGGKGNYPLNGGAGGGGASDVRQGGSQLQNRVIVAGGAGGGGLGVYGFYGWGAGGAGGGETGQDGGPGPSYPSGGGGGGGSQTQGGLGGPGGVLSGTGGAGGPGSLAIGGSGGCCTQNSAGGGGGGAGGYYGGGGGGAGVIATSGSGGGGGGGGGSSYFEPSATHVTNTQGGASAGNGRVIISW